MGAEKNLHGAHSEKVFHCCGLIVGTEMQVHIVEPLVHKGILHDGEYDQDRENKVLYKEEDMVGALRRALPARIARRRECCEEAHCEKQRQQ